MNWELGHAILGTPLGKMVYRIIYAAILVICCTTIFSIAAQDDGMNAYDVANIMQMVYGQAPKPYVTRVLVPVMTRAIVEHLPEGLATRVDMLPGQFSFIQAHMKKTAVPLNATREYIFIHLITFSCLLAFPFALHYLFKGLFSTSSLYIDVWTIAGALGVSAFLGVIMYPYDFSTLLLSTIGLAAMLRKHFIVFLATFFLASFNKETSILLTLIFALYFWPDMKKSAPLRLLLAAQAGIYLLSRVVLAIVFRDNIGGPVEIHFLHSNLGYGTAYSLATITSYLVIIILCGYKWADKPLYLKICMVTLPILLGTYIFFGFFGEIRVFYEIYPVVLALMLHSVARIWEIPIRNLSAR